MKKTITIAIASAIIGLASTTACQAANLIQPLSVSLVVYDSSGNRVFGIGTPQFIRFLWGSNVADGHLYLVTPVGNTPGQTGALNGWLRITSGTTTIYEIPSVSQFNLYQDVAVLKANGAMLHASAAINRFSFDTGAVRAELQGISTWTIWNYKTNGVPLWGAGAFTSHVNGWMDIYNTTQGQSPVSGTIIALRPTVGN